MEKTILKQRKLTHVLDDVRKARINNPAYLRKFLAQKREVITPADLVKMAKELQVFTGMNNTWNLLQTTCDEVDPNIMRNFYTES